MKASILFAALAVFGRAVATLDATTTRDIDPCGQPGIDIDLKPIYTYDGNFKLLVYDAEGNSFHPFVNDQAPRGGFAYDNNFDGVPTPDGGLTFTLKNNVMKTTSCTPVVLGFVTSPKFALLFPAVSSSPNLKPPKWQINRVCDKETGKAVLEVDLEEKYNTKSGSK